MEKKVRTRSLVFMWSLALLGNALDVATTIYARNHLPKVRELNSAFRVAIEKKKYGFLIWAKVIVLGLFLIGPLFLAEKGKRAEASLRHARSFNAVWVAVFWNALQIFLYNRKQARTP